MAYHFGFPQVQDRVVLGRDGGAGDVWYVTSVDVDAGTARVSRNDPRFLSGSGTTIEVSLDEISPFVENPRSTMTLAERERAVLDADPTVRRRDENLRKLFKAT